MSVLEKTVCADCFEEMATMPDDSVYCTITDFPYGDCSGYNEGGLRKINRDLADKDADGSEFDYIRATKELCRISKGSVFIFCGFAQASDILKTMRDCGMNLTRIIVWEKPNVSPMNGQYGFLNSIETAVFGRKSGAYWGGHCEHCVLVHQTQPLDWHPTAKPIPLLQKLIKFMCPEGETVFDCCAGSFGTAVAAHELGRGYYCIEKNPEFYEKAMDYYKERLGQQLLF